MDHDGIAVVVLARTAAVIVASAVAKLVHAAVPSLRMDVCKRDWKGSSWKFSAG